MKTTLDISAALVSEMRKLAVREQTTLRALVEEGLRQVLKERNAKPAFRLRDASVKGRGLQPEFADADWNRIREASYEGGAPDPR